MSITGRYMNTKGSDLRINKVCKGLSLGKEVVSIVCEDNDWASVLWYILRKPVGARARHIEHSLRG
jgi:hypothetical protein